MTQIAGKLLSLCMIVKNESLNLVSCLESVRGIAGEIIVVDTGSADPTAELALQCGARVLSFDFSHPDFAAARNHALSHAAGEWIIVLDADETLHHDSKPEIERLIRLNQNAGYYFSRNNYTSNCETPSIDHVIRLFPNRPDYRYRGRVHETIHDAILAGGGKLIQTNVQIDHSFATDPHSRREKNLWYIDILKQELSADPTDLSRLDFLAAEYHQLGMFDDATAVTERIVAARPSDPFAHLSVGVYYLLHKHDLVRARAHLDQALMLRPGYPEALSFLRTLEAQERDTIA